MDYLPQNASGLYLEIQKIGCFFRAACNLAEREAAAQGKYRHALSVDELNRLWTRSCGLGFIGSIKRSDGTVEKFCVKDSAAIATIALGELGVPGKFQEVATTINGEKTWYGGLNHLETAWIEKISQNGPSKTHYNVADKDGNTVWDPHEPGINKIKQTLLIHYRYTR